MYNGKHDLRVTTRCPYCKNVTVAELDYEVEKDMLGKTIAEIIPEVLCGRCSKISFNRSRFDFTEVSAMVNKEKEKQPQSIVLEVQSLRHVMRTIIQPVKEEEQKDGEKH